MRRIAFAAVVAVLGWAPGAEAATVACGPAKARTLKAAGESRVFARGERIYACVAGSRSRRLGTREDPEECVTVCDGVAHIAVAGRFVAWNVTSSHTHGEDPGFFLETLDLRSGRTRMRAQAGDAGFEDAVLTRLVLSPTGDTAWAYRHTRSSLGQEPAGVAIQRDPRCGRPVVDDGKEVDARSLRLHGGRLVWRSGGDTRSARLCRRRSAPMPVCGRPGGKTVAATRTSRVWKPSGRGLWGCTRGSSPVFLQSAEPTELTLAHRFVAFARVEPAGFEIVAANLATRTARTAGAAGDSARLLQLALNMRGRVAYLYERGDQRTLARDAACSPQMIDQGPGLEPRFSLVGINTLWWTVGNEIKNAPLC